MLAKLKKAAASQDAGLEESEATDAAEASGEDTSEGPGRLLGSRRLSRFWKRARGKEDP